MNTPFDTGRAASAPLPQRRPGPFLPMLAAAALALALALALGLAIDVQRQGQDARNELLRAEIARLDERGKRLTALRAEVEGLKGRQKFLEAWSAQARWPAGMLALLAQSRTDGLWFDRAAETGAGLRLLGSARNYGEVERLIVKLGALPAVERIELAELRPDATADTIRFAVTVAVKPVVRPLSRESLPPWTVTRPKDPP